MIEIISKNIKNIRKKLQYSQEDVAERLGMSRQTYISIESGNRDITTEEIDKLSALFKVTPSEIIEENRNNEKFIEMYQFVLSIFNKSGIPKTKLAKILYLCDFRYFYDNLKSITGVHYIHRQFGPLADIFGDTTYNMEDNGQITITYTPNQAQIIKSKMYKPKFNLLTEDEKIVIKEICTLWMDKSTEEIVNFTHEQKPWSSSNDGEYIPYSLIIQEDPDHVYQPVE
ncbi:MAG: helix-turn-helix domain-containing protein [Bifidobacteriaceae bacterium]|jgi:transcriptional regulator with XRE-family HTH domain|nr:helix-turn-helix domain-containing protein [Bifidobacteriaceae bacterium]